MPDQTKLSHLFYRLGAPAFFCALAAYSQLSWAADHQAYQELAPRLAAALALGLILGGMLPWAVERLARRRNPDPGLLASLICLALWPGLLCLPGVGHPAFFWAGLIAPPLLLAVLAARHWRDVSWHNLGKGLGYCLLMTVVSVALSGLAGEFALREAFLLGDDYNFVPPEWRGAHETPVMVLGQAMRFDTHAKPRDPGAVRVMILGDSITHGAGISDAHQLYVNLLADELSHGKKHYEFSTYAQCGREVDGHLEQLRRHGPEYKPNIIIYQWYCNDITVDKTGMPWPEPTWLDTMPGHDWLSSHSILWHYLAYLGRGFGHQSFEDYLNSQFQPGSDHWTKFCFYYKSLLAEATTMADRVIVLMYPAMPFAGVDKGHYSLAALERRVKSAALSEYLEIPAESLPHAVGAMVADPESRRGTVCRADTSREGFLCFGPYITLAGGQYHVIYRLKYEGPAPKGTLARLEVTAEMGKQVLASRRIGAADFAGPGQWRSFELHFKVPMPRVEQLEFRVWDEARAPLTLDGVDFYWPLNKPVQFVDGIDFLGGMHTWVNPYDGHPSPKAHELVAEALAQVIEPDIGAMHAHSKH